MAIKYSLCLTSFNEDENVSVLMQSILKQRFKVDEIIVIDSNSTDKTLSILKHFAKKDKRIKVISQQGSIAASRNLAIEVSRGEIILVTDFGCKLDQRWAGEIVKLFKNKDVDVVAGKYIMKHKNSFQKIAKNYIGLNFNQIELSQSTVMPSCRSVAFRKSAWEKVFGFNQKLSAAAEDTDFFYRLYKSGSRFVYNKKAFVYWLDTEKLTWISLFNKISFYASGDVKALIVWHPHQKFNTHILKIMSVYLRYIFLVVTFFVSLNTFLFLTLIYMLFIFYKRRHDNLKVHEFFLVIPVQLVSDFAVIYGAIKGIIAR